MDGKNNVIPYRKIPLFIGVFFVLIAGLFAGWGITRSVVFGFKPVFDPEGIYVLFLARSFPLVFPFIFFYAALFWFTQPRVVASFLWASFLGILYIPLLFFVLLFLKWLLNFLPWLPVILFYLFFLPGASWAYLGAKMAQGSNRRIKKVGEWVGCVNRRPQDDDSRTDGQG